MSRAIPIRNLYYLLSYAWEHFREGDEVDVSAEACPDLANLLARVLANGIMDAHDAEQAPPAWPSRVLMPINIDKDRSRPDAPDDEFIYWSN